MTMFSKLVTVFKTVSSWIAGKRGADEGRGASLRNQNGTDLTRTEIIEKYLNTLAIRDDRRYSVDDHVRDCIQEIAELEGRRSEAPNHLYLRKWFQNAPPDLHTLAASIRLRFERRLADLNRTKQMLEIETKTLALKARYSSLITAFYDVAERKVSLRDDYGEERWDLLEKEIDRVIKKIKTKEGYADSRGLMMEPGVDRVYKQLSVHLNESFREHHDRERVMFPDGVDYKSMSGVDFEVFLMKLLGRLGFTDICGTPVTGDQGADILAKKDGKLFVIQAKRYGSSVGNKAVQEVSSAIQFYSADEAWVVTNSTFTKSARELALRTGVRLINGHELARLSDRVDKG